MRKALSRALTDAGPTVPDSPKSEPIENLFSLMKVVSAPDVIGYFDSQYKTCQIRYGDLKKQLAEDIIIFTEPLREKILELSANENYLSKVARIGAEKAHESGAKTVKEVREIIGFRKF